MRISTVDDCFNWWWGFKIGDRHVNLRVWHAGGTCISIESLWDRVMISSFITINIHRRPGVTTTIHIHHVHVQVHCSMTHCRFPVRVNLSRKTLNIFWLFWGLGTEILLEPLTIIKLKVVEAMFWCWSMQAGFGWGQGLSRLFDRLSNITIWVYDIVQWGSVGKSKKLSAIPGCVAFWNHCVSLYFNTGHFWIAALGLLSWRWFRLFVMEMSTPCMGSTSRHLVHLQLTSCRFWVGGNWKN